MSRFGRRDRSTPFATMEDLAGLPTRTLAYRQLPEPQAPIPQGTKAIDAFTRQRLQVGAIGITIEAGFDEKRIDSSNGEPRPVIYLTIENNTGVLTDRVRGRHRLAAKVTNPSVDLQFDTLSLDGKGGFERATVSDRYELPACKPGERVRVVVPIGDKYASPGGFDHKPVIRSTTYDLDGIPVERRFATATPPEKRAIPMLDSVRQTAYVTHAAAAQEQMLPGQEAVVGVIYDRNHFVQAMKDASDAYTERVARDTAIVDGPGETIIGGVPTYAVPASGKVLAETRNAVINEIPLSKASGWSL